MTTEIALMESADPILDARGLSFRHRGNNVDLFANVSLSMMPAERAAIIGANGTGKSTFMRLVLGDHSCGMFSGVLRLGTTSAPVQLSDLAYVGDLGLSQDYHGLPYGYAVESLIRVQHDLVGSFADGLLSRIETLLGIPTMAAKRTEQLSAGERKRLQLSLALSKRPRLLLADEPFENIDADRGELIPLMRDFLSSHGIALLLVTHRREEAEILCEAMYAFGASGCHPLPRCPVSVTVSGAGMSTSFSASGLAAMSVALLEYLDRSAEARIQVVIQRDKY